MFLEKYSIFQTTRLILAPSTATLVPSPKIWSVSSALERRKRWLWRENPKVSVQLLPQ